MAFGFGVLRRSSDEFWRMTPREIAAARDALSPRTAQALGRYALDELMRRFPDKAAAPAGARNDG